MQQIRETILIVIKLTPVAQYRYRCAIIRKFIEC